MKWTDIKVLLLEDDPDYMSIIADLISRSRTGVRHPRHAKNLEEAFQLLDAYSFDVALCDLRLADGGGLEILSSLRARAPRLPIVVLATQQDEDHADQALESGAQELLLKEEAQPRLLMRVMRYAMERMQGEIALRASEQRMKVILDSAQVGILVVDPEDHTIADVNPAALAMMGRSRDEVVGRECHHHVCPAQKDKCPITDLKQELDKSERELVLADGSTIPILKTVNTIELGGRAHLLEIFVDFSELKAAREVLVAAKDNLVREVKRRTRQLEQAKSQWEATFDAVPDLISINDCDHRIVMVNRAMARRLGLEPGEIVGRFCYEIMHERNAPIGACPHAKLLEDGQEHMAEFYEAKLDGDFLVSTSPLFDSEGQVYASVHVARDISELKEAERALQSQLEFINTIVETIPNPIFIKDKAGVYTGCNSAFSEMLGKPKQEIIGSTVHDIAPREEADLFERQDKDLFGKPGVRIYESQMNRHGAGLREVIFYKATFTRESGEVDGLVGVILDITERKWMEEQLVRAQKLEAIGLLSAGIAHEINTPTQFIHNNLEFLAKAFENCDNFSRALIALVTVLREGQPSREALEAAEAVLGEEDPELMREDVRDALRETMQGVERITKIVESMRYFSRPGTEQKEYLDLNKAIKHAITVSRNEWKYCAEVSTDLAPELPPVLGYTAPLNQVLLNIIINAAQAISGDSGDNTAGEGRIAIITRQVGERVEMRISDNGPGIPDDVLPNIFNPFFTTKEVGKGTGQGLALAHNVVVDKHGGILDVETRLGEGTTFILLLPIE